MMRDDKDRSSKWLIEHHGNSIVWLAGVRGFRAWRPVQPELVQPRQLPDGLLEVFFPDQANADLFLLELATYPERRIEEQVIRDSLLVFADRRAMPEVITVILRPHGTFRLTGVQQLTSRLGTFEIAFRWRVVELWTLPATELLAANDVGLIPWAPLAQFEGAPEVLIEQCRERIDAQATPEEKPNLLAVTQVMARLRYNDPGLLTLLGGSRVMIESPLIQEMMSTAEAIGMQKAILEGLESRIGTVPADVAAAIRLITGEEKLREVSRLATVCPDFETLRAKLQT
jgi:predicted transposase YdaD